MSSNNNIKQLAIDTIDMEAKSVENLKGFVNDEFVTVVELIHNSKGRVVITGIGKSAVIAQKIVATLNSTGTPALFMHAADAIHGDLGMIQENDVVVIISKSGESPEIKVLIPFIKNFGNKVVALCGNEQSYLAKSADYWINSTVSQEACPNNLAPTTSTTAQLVMGDALAVCLLSLKGFTAEDFARFHPGGALGKRMYLRVEDLCRANECPAVREDASIKEIIYEISNKRLGATAVTKGDELLGIITDGDIRRMLEKGVDTNELKATDILSSNPKTIDQNELAAVALEMIRKNNITQIVVTNEGKYVGMVHLHDLIREGLI
ncbi:MAG: KpsF/GutQ family sugar-phosphate isomerase [Flavipsychrobacter sp.]